jgi:hypothetical protein
MAQYAVLIYAHDSAHAPQATPEDLELTANEAERAFLLSAHGAIGRTQKAAAVRGDLGLDLDL